MSRRPSIDSPSPALEALHRVTGGPENHLDENAPFRCLGMPSGIHTTNQQARYGDLLYLDPTNASSALIVTLPPSDRRRIGEKITIKNYSASTNPIRVVAQDGETIDKAAYQTLTTAWALSTVVLAGNKQWITTDGGAAAAIGLLDGRVTIVEGNVTTINNQILILLGLAAHQGAWSLLTNLAGTAPPVRHYTAAAWDHLRGEAIMFGGTAAAGLLDDTYGFNRRWSQKAPATVPTARAYHVMDYDPTGGRVLMGFGAGAGTVNRQDIFEWTGTNWAELADTSPPSARRETYFSVDAWTNEAMIFGGYASAPDNSMYTLNLSTLAWTDRTPGPLPPSWPAVRYGGSMCWCPQDGCYYLFGGSKLLPTVYHRDLWKCDPNNSYAWTQVIASLDTVGARYNGLVWVPAWQRIVLIAWPSTDGATGPSATDHQLVYAFDPAAATPAWTLVGVIPAWNGATADFDSRPPMPWHQAAGYAVDTDRHRLYALCGRDHGAALGTAHSWELVMR